MDSVDFDRYDQIYYDFFSKRQRIDLPHRVHKCKKACEGCLACGGKNFNYCYYDCKTCKRCQDIGSPHMWNMYDKSFPQLPRHPEYSVEYGPALVERGVPHHKAYKISEYAMATGECDATCGPKACDEYRERMLLYNDCLLSNRAEECNKKFGCQTHRGFRYRFHPPINPKYTNCQRCWRMGFTSI